MLTTVTVLVAVKSLATSAKPKLSVDSRKAPPAPRRIRVGEGLGAHEGGRIDETAAERHAVAHHLRGIRRRDERRTDVLTRPVGVSLDT